MALGVLINYIDRVNISHVIVPLSKELSLTPAQQGVVLSAFSWGYVAFMVIGGILVDRLGAVRMAGFAAALWSIATCWTGFTNIFFSVLGSRMLLGASEAPIFPANARLVRDNFPIEERGRATAIFDAGSYVGIALTAPLVVFVTLQFGWRVSFIACGILGACWVAIWFRYASKLTTNENGSLKRSARMESISRKQFFELVRNRKVIGASYGFFCYNYAKSFYLTWFPAYLISEKGYSFLSVGFVGTIPPIFAVIGGLSAGWATDTMIKKGVSLTYARKVPLCAGLIFSSTVVLADFVTSQYVVIAILSFSFAATIAASPGIWAIPGDIAPTNSMVGTIGGIQNTFSNMAGIIAPIITGTIVGLYGSFIYALLLTSILTITGTISYWFIVGDLSQIELEGGS